MKRFALAILSLALVLPGCESKPTTSTVADIPPAPVPAPDSKPAMAATPEPAAAEGEAVTPVVVPRSGLFRGLWVTRFDFRTPDDVRRVITDAATLGTTDIFWQVRGQADAYYESKLEPWGRELLRDAPPNVSTPGFDPLQLATEYAHQNGMRLHAWLNIMPLWKGTTPPTDPRHPYNAHPNWRLHDDKGKAQALNEHYVIVNPVLDEVQDHIVAVVRDIVTRYPVDGIHMDYIRFVSEKMEGGGATLPGDPTSLAMFRAATGHKGVATAADKAAFEGWKRSHITRLVHRIREEGTSARPGVELSAAVWRRPDYARDQYLQDSALWLNEGSIDRAIPMIYTDKDEQFESDLKMWVAATPDRSLTPGLGTYMHALGQTPRQLKIAAELDKAGGYCLFSYAAIFETVDPSQRKDAKSIQERSNRRQSIKDYVTPPSPGAR